jgi:GTP-binding protein EngB required for normal cell division
MHIGLLRKAKKGGKVAGESKSDKIKRRKEEKQQAKVEQLLAKKGTKSRIKKLFSSGGEEEVWTLLCVSLLPN